MKKYGGITLQVETPKVLPFLVLEHEQVVSSRSTSGIPTSCKFAGTKTNRKVILSWSLGDLFGWFVGIGDSFRSTMILPQGLIGA